MSTPTENTATLDDLDLALAGLDLETTEAGEEAGEENIVDEVLKTVSDEIVDEIVEEVTAADTALADDALRDLDIGLEIAEVYAETKADEAIDPAGAKEKAKTAGTKTDTTTKRAKKAEGTGRAPRDVSTVPAEFFALTEPAADADPEAIKAATLKLKPEQKKIAEKFDNLFSALSVGKAPSTYVMLAFELLDEKKEMTSADLVARYKANELKEGTARSQTGQIMNLFATVGIAARAGQVLKLNADSKIAERIRALPKAA